MSSGTITIGGGIKIDTSYLLGIENNGGQEETPNIISQPPKQNHLDLFDFGDSGFTALA